MFSPQDQQISISLNWGKIEWKTKSFALFMFQTKLPLTPHHSHNHIQCCLNFWFYFWSFALLYQQFLFFFFPLFWSFSTLFETSSLTFSFPFFLFFFFCFGCLFSQVLGFFFIFYFFYISFGFLNFLCYFFFKKISFI